jgi:lysophospholipase L1-like esterase
MWVNRHKAHKELAKSGRRFDLVLVGDSITHGWGGEPRPNANWKGAAANHYDALFGPYRPINLGISADRTQHVLYRLDDGAMDGVNPKVCMVMIGTNNIGTNSEVEIAAGVKAVVMKLREKAPRTKVLLCSILPRETEVGTIRKKVAGTNAILAAERWPDWVTYVDCWPGFLEADGRMKPGLMPDQLHPNAAGYLVWGDAIEVPLRRLMNSR